ncbi:hypothetical protein OE699_04030 [Sedimentimonas flavescens]|uniref:Flp pilus-assembly TadE/G-like protein n=1 Tax=Sedimentimonas flavescens TaxID=2851012 RepID=A0ABT2ZWM8_9RHOB|nr:hypothetical protein [Sedimentimonas flavescens]MCV2878012.1 hypothetical protein [Sedimentimonas flavescens]
MTDRVRKALKNEDGAILVFWAMCLMMILGIVALSFDLGRYGITRTEYQSFVDNVAITAAGELDGASTAISRATSAAALVADTHHFGVADKTLSGAADYTLTFLSALGSATDGSGDTVTTDPAEAAYVRVTATPTSVLSTFASVLAHVTNSGSLDGSVNASAVAGFNRYACDISPMFVCVPNGFKSKDYAGRSILMRSGGGGSWQAGNFGFLDPALNGYDEAGPCKPKNGNQSVDKDCLIAAVKGVTQCFSQRKVQVSTGEQTSIASAFNVRFDWYANAGGNASTWINNADFAPAPHVVTGLQREANGCLKQNANTASDSVPFPADDCHGASGTGCTLDTTGRFGDGDWDSGKEAYFLKNYGVSASAHPNGSLATRYQLYIKEIADRDPSSNKIFPTHQDHGYKTCTNVAPAGPDRRVLIIAAVDCSAGFNGASVNQIGVPVIEFFKVFMLRPVAPLPGTGNEGKFDIYGEVIGPVDAGGTGSNGIGGIIRDMVQLYR